MLVLGKNPKRHLAGLLSLRRYPFFLRLDSQLIIKGRKMMMTLLRVMMSEKGYDETASGVVMISEDSYDEPLL